MSSGPEREQTLEFTFTLKAEEQLQYIEIPFEVPAGVERVHASYTYEALSQGRCVIDLGLRDAKRVRGWSGGARTECFVQEDASTPGYRRGSVEPGIWAVLLGTYRIPPAGCEARVRVTMTYAKLSWLAGDLHSHTEHSDGSYTLEEAVRIMNESGCDFLATTDHNTCSQNYDHPAASGLVLIPGMELTTYHGHANFLGVVEPVRDFRVLTQEDAENKLQEAKSSGALRVLNHPFCDNCPWEWGMDAGAEAVEIWNGPWRELNRKALDWWQGQLALGKRLVAVGGSDVHRPHPYVKHAHPTTWVNSRSRTKDAILEGIAGGRVYLAFAPYGPKLEMSSGEYGIGQVAPSVLTPVNLRLERLASGDLVKLITNRGIAGEWEIADDTGRLETDWQASDESPLFVRVEVWRYFQEADGLCPVLLSNPIYFDE